MPKRKDVSLDELLGGKPKSTPDPTQATPARKRAPKSSPAGSDQQVRKAAGKARDSKALAAEYDRYGQPWAVRLPPALIAELKRIAEREGVNYGALTRWALQQFTANYKAGRIDLGKAKRPKGYDL